MLRRTSPVLVAFLLMGGVAAGQEQAAERYYWSPIHVERLAFIDQVYISVLIDENDEDVQGCRIRPDAVRLAGQRSFLDAGIKVARTPEINVSHVQVSVTTVKTAVCAAAVSTAVIDIGSYMPGHIRTPEWAESKGDPGLFVKTIAWATGPLELESAERLLIGPADSFGDRVNTTVGQLLDELATKIKLANQPK